MHFLSKLLFKIARYVLGTLTDCGVRELSPLCYGCLKNFLMHGWLETQEIKITQFCDRFFSIKMRKAHLLDFRRRHLHMWMRYFLSFADIWWTQLITTKSKLLETNFTTCSTNLNLPVSFISLTLFLPIKASCKT